MEPCGQRQTKSDSGYVSVAVVLVCIVLAIFMDSFLVPVFFMLSIGMAIVYNLGSNYFLGEVSYITKALAAVLQLGVTLDYSIFLWHSYKEAKEETPDDQYLYGLSFLVVLANNADGNSY